MFKSTHWYIATLPRFSFRWLSTCSCIKQVSFLTMFYPGIYSNFYVFSRLQHLGSQNTKKKIKNHISQVNMGGCFSARQKLYSETTQIGKFGISLDYFLISNETDTMAYKIKLVLLVGPFYQSHVRWRCLVGHFFGKCRAAVWKLIHESFCTGCTVE